ncbi:MAG: helix-turn-helix domain-containing protein [Oscillospiraceae bacterium]|nr:helix-turn-helix domain-containing protein [Oscillospiraceae bacterium]
MDKKAIQINFGNNLKKYRSLSGKSQEELAFEAEISSVYLGIIERGERCPTIDTLLKISAVLKISPSRLLDFSGEIDDTEACYAIKYALRDIPDKDKMRLIAVFEQLVRIYKGDF